MKTRGLAKHIAAATLAIIVWTIAPGTAQTVYVWTGGSGGGGDAWRNGNSWSPVAHSTGPGAYDIAVFGTKGTSGVIGINLNDGRGNTQEVGAVELLAGQDRIICNSSPNADGVFRINGSGGKLLLNSSTAGTLTLANGPDRAMDVLFASGGSVDVVHAGARIAIAGRLAGAAGFTKTGQGVLELSASNSITGAIIVDGGTLRLSAKDGNALGAAKSVRVDAGATLQLAASNQLGDSTSLILNGGTLLAGSASGAFVEALGTLTLTADSTLDLGGGAGQSIIHFADSSAVAWERGAVLTIKNWRDVASDAAAATRLIFGQGGLTSPQLAQIRFDGFGAGSRLTGPDGELVPIPEAPVSAAAVALLVFIAWRERRHIAHCLSGWHAARAATRTLLRRDSRRDHAWTSKT